MSEISPARKFLFCFAPHYGVFALSYLFIVGGFILAITGWMQVAEMETYYIPTNYQWALWMHALVFTTLVLLGVYGVVSASMKRGNLLSGLLAALGIHFICSVVTGSFMMSLVYTTPSTSAISSCLSIVNTSNPTAVQFCFNPINMAPNAVALIYFVLWLIELYASFISWSMLRQVNAQPSDLEKKGLIVVPRRTGIDPLAIGHPRPLPKKPSMSLTMGNNGYPISIIDGLMTPGAHSSVQQHSWDGNSMIAPRKPPPAPPRDSPPTTPVTPSRPDTASGMKPFMLPKQQDSPAFPPGLGEGNGTTTPRQPYSLGSAGLHPSYTFTNDNAAKTPTQATFGKQADRI